MTCEIPNFHKSNVIGISCLPWNNGCYIESYWKTFIREINQGSSS